MIREPWGPTARQRFQNAAVGKVGELGHAPQSAPVIHVDGYHRRIPTLRTPFLATLAFFFGRLFGQHAALRRPNVSARPFVHSAQTEPVGRMDPSRDHGGLVWSRFYGPGRLAVLFSAVQIAFEQRSLHFASLPTAGVGTPPQPKTNNQLRGPKETNQGTASGVGRRALKAGVLGVGRALVGCFGNTIAIRPLFFYLFVVRVFYLLPDTARVAVRPAH